MTSVSVDNYLCISFKQQLNEQVAALKTKVKEQQEQINIEITDRFGKLPIEIENLLQDPGKSYDNRWMHRPIIDWKKNGAVEPSKFLIPSLTTWA